MNFALVLPQLPRINRLPRFAAIAAILPALSACSTAMVRPVAPGPNAPPVMRVYDTRAGKDITFDAMIAAASEADIVFFGEQHDDPVTHTAEMAVFAALSNKREKVLLSLEMFERDVQPLLDDYLTGRTNEKDFLAGSRPWDRYATDYRPVLEHARLNRWPVIAANIPRPIASSIARNGLAHLDTIARTQRAFAAQENQCAFSGDYYQKFVEVMGGGAQHAATPGDSAAARATLNRYYEAQCVKDEAMGESIIRAWERSGKGTILLHVNGAFHSDYRLGTVERVVRRKSDAKIVVITGVPVPDPVKGNPAEHADKADYLIFTMVRK